MRTYPAVAGATATLKRRMANPRTNPRRCRTIAITTCFYVPDMPGLTPSFWSCLVYIQLLTVGVAPPTPPPPPPPRAPHKHTLQTLGRTEIKIHGRLEPRDVETCRQTHANPMPVGLSTPMYEYDPRIYLCLALANCLYKHMAT